jgi:hypothetical protein
MNGGGPQPPVPNDPNRVDAGADLLYCAAFRMATMP